jgi:transcriptional regulator NrdR family protein
MSVGIPCPKCRCPSSTVLDSRATGQQTRRRRQCDRCKTRFNTMEFSEDQMDVYRAQVRRMEIAAIRAQAADEVVALLKGVA